MYICPDQYVILTADINVTQVTYFKYQKYSRFEHRMIRSSAKILKDAVGEIILNGKYA
jgi:hypothetical protein